MGVREAFHAGMNELATPMMTPINRMSAATDGSKVSVFNCVMKAGA